jgi:hypothetical protein
LKLLEVVSGTPDALPTIMMRKIIPLTALVLGLSGGVALADRDHGRGGERHSAPQNHVVVRGDHHASGAVVVRDHRGGYNGYRGGYNGYNGYRGGYNGHVVVHNAPRYHGVVRRPIFVARPVIHRRYFSYYQRPSLIVENYSAMPGYFWVPGTWTWNGYEWIWQPGHYQPDPNYIDPGYDAYDGY